MKGIETRCEQYDDQWWEIRIDKVTGSEIHDVMLHPERALKEHVRKRLRLPGFAGNEATRYGKRAEAHARRWHERKTRRKVRLVGFVTHPVFGRFGASPDGMMLRDSMVTEYKCPHSGVVPNRPKPAHVAQVRWNMFVTGATKGQLVYWVPDDDEPGAPMPRLFDITQDDGFIQDAQEAALELLAKADDICADPVYAQEWLFNQEGNRVDEEWSNAALAYREALAIKKEAEEAVEQAKATLLVLAGDKNAGGVGVQVSWVTRQGSVGWTRLAKKYGIADDVIESYRAPPSRYARVTADD